MHDLLLTVCVGGLLTIAVVLAMGEYRTAGMLRRLDAVLEKASENKAAGGSMPASLRYAPGKLVRMLEQVDIEPSLRDVVLLAGAFIILLLGVGMFAGLLAVVMAAIFLISAGYGVLSITAARRVAQISALLPAFFERVRQLLTIGNSLPMAFSRAVHSSQPMLVQFFTPTMRRLGNGASFSDSVQQCAEDSDVYELRLFAAAVATNMRFGGSLTHSLTNLVAYLRKRASIERELKSSTAQIRGSAWVLGLLPLLVASLIVGQNREYARWFISHPTGKMMLVYCIVSQIIGAFVMRKIVRTKY